MPKPSQSILLILSTIDVTRTLLAIAVQRNWFLQQLDIKTASLRGILTEDIYIKQSEGLNQV